MTREKEAHALSRLEAEQKEVQAGKFRTRLLQDYNALLFLQSGTQHSEVIDFIRPYTDASSPNIINIIETLQTQKPDGETVHWADFGGGHGMALRQATHEYEGADLFTATNVDLIEPRQEDITSRAKGRLEREYPELLTNDALAPHFMQADAATARLATPADLITSIEMIQYHDHPLKAIANMYNQLADDGLFMLGTDHLWPVYIGYENDFFDGPTRDFFEALERDNIEFAASAEVDWPNGYRPERDPLKCRSLIIKKRPRTTMHVELEVAEVSANFDNYKSVIYEPRSAHDLPIWIEEDV